MHTTKRPKERERERERDIAISHTDSSVGWVIDDNDDEKQYMGKYGQAKSCQRKEREIVKYKLSVCFCLSIRQRNTAQLSLSLPVATVSDSIIVRRAAWVGFPGNRIKSYNGNVNNRVPLLASEAS